MDVRQLYRNHPRFIRYMIFGIISTGVEFLAYVLLYKFIPYLSANIIAFHLGVVCSFILNRKFNFKKEDKTVLRFASFYLIQVVCLVLNTLILYLLVDVFHLNAILAKAISILLTALIPFFLNRDITFGKHL